MDKALLSTGKPVVLIAGGRDKGFAFDPLDASGEGEGHIDCSESAKWPQSISRSWDGAWSKSKSHRRLTDAVERAHASANPGKSFFFPGHVVASTCSKATSIEAIDFARSCKLCPQTDLDENPAPP